MEFGFNNPIPHRWCLNNQEEYLPIKHPFAVSVWKIYVPYSVSEEIYINKPYFALIEDKQP
jgi:hypothetical protein